MSVTVLILAKFVEKKAAVLLKYKSFTYILQRLNLDNKITFFSRTALRKCFRILKVLSFLGLIRRRSTC